MSAGIQEDPKSSGARSPSGPFDPEVSQPSPPCAPPFRTPSPAPTPDKPHPSPDPCSFLREIARAMALLKGRTPPQQEPPKARRIRRIFEAPGEGIRASDGAATGGVGHSPVSPGVVEAARILGAPGLPEERARRRYRSYADCKERASSPCYYRRRVRYRSVVDCLNDPDFFVMKKKEIASKEDKWKKEKDQGSHDVTEDEAEIAEDEATATEDTANHLHDATGSKIPEIMRTIKHRHTVTFTKGFSVTHLKISTWEELHLKAFGAYNQTTPMQIKLLARSDMVGYFSAGWTHFARANSIKVGDLCAFQFDDKLSSVIVRVIKEAAAAIKGIGMEAPGASIWKPHPMKLPFSSHDVTHD